VGWGVSPGAVGGGGRRPTPWLVLAAKGRQEHVPGRLDELQVAENHIRDDRRLRCAGGGRGRHERAEGFENHSDEVANVGIEIDDEDVNTFEARRIVLAHEHRA
jgi:hypothetical protein